MDFIKDRMNGLKAIGFGAAVPGLRDQLFNAVNNVTASDEDQKAKIKSVIDEENSKKSKQAMAMRRSKGMGMKKGGKVSSASKRADGCAIKGKTKGKMV